MNRFVGRVALVTGSASGIGRAIARRMAQEGASLALLDSNVDGLRSLVGELERDYQARVAYEVCDVTLFDEVAHAVDGMSECLGGLQVLSHNAGIMRCYHTHEMSAQQWQEIIDVNLTGMFNVNRHALRHLLKNSSSAIVNTASIAVDQPHPWLTAYAASKGGIRSFTRSLFIEYSQQGLRANCILPGGVNTQLAKSFTIPEGGDARLVGSLMPIGELPLVDPASVAGVVAMLASDDARFINGTEVRVDGGMMPIVD